VEQTGATALRAQISSKTEQKLPKVAYRGLSPSGASGPTLPSGETLDFLEAKPYWDQSTLPINVAKQKDPFIGKILSSQKIVGPTAAGEINNVVIDHRGELPYWEGQSYGVLPTGIDPKKNKPYGVRLYSIASTRYGDDKLGKTTTLCIRRAIYVDPETGKEDPAKKGVCSNMLCDAKPGDEIKITGPSGKVLLMPEDKKDTKYIMVATGTGIAPFRGFMRRLFGEGNPRNKDYKGTAWLFLGVAGADSLLYDEEFQIYKQQYPNNVRLDYALSREGEKNKKGGKMYIQDKMESYADEIFTQLDNGAHIYFCGLKGMMPGIQDMLEAVCKSKGIDYSEWLEALRHKNQWHVEVY
jgi:ferredoxin--NADP+ reductase